MKWLVVFAVVVGSFVAQEVSAQECEPLAGLDEPLIAIDGQCFLIARASRNWFGAVNYCKLFNLTIANFETQREYEKVSATLRRRKLFGNYWFGANDLETEGIFTYINTGRGMGFLSEPHTLDNWDRDENCLAIRVSKSVSAMEDSFCLNQYPFICELYGNKDVLL